MLNTNKLMAIHPPPTTHQQHSPISPNNSMPPPTLPNGTAPSATSLSAQSSTVVDAPVGNRIAGGSGSSNSEAGPSSPPFFFMKPRPGPPPVRLRLHPSTDLVTRMGLLPAFDEFVRPYIRIPPELSEKGKGKEVNPSPDEGDKKKEHEKGWKNLVTAVSGKFPTKKDTYLGDLVQYIEPRPRMNILTFDRSTLRHFHLEEGSLPPDVQQQLGVGAESEKKKLKKKKKTQEAAMNGTAGPSGSTPAAEGSTQPPPNPGALQPPLPNPGVHKGWLKRGHDGPVISGTAPSDYIRVPVDGNPWHGMVVPPEMAIGDLPPGYTYIPNKKVKREREEGGSGSGQQSPSGSSSQTPAPVANGSSSTPRPHKKRKMDGQAAQQRHGLGPHTPQQPMQQPTPTF